jgi:hypothetical protein
LTVIEHAESTRTAQEAAERVGVTLGQIEISIVRFSMDRNLLWVDDFYSTNFDQVLWMMPREGHSSKPYHRYEKGLLRADGGPGFNTPTGKIEFWSRQYEQWGLDPLPYYEDALKHPAFIRYLWETLA